MNKNLEILKEIEIIRNKKEFTQLEKDNYYKVAPYQLDMIEQTLTPPTTEEVCEALSEYLGEEVYYKEDRFFDDFRTIAIFVGCRALIHIPLPPRLITMIGRFYEGGMNDE